ncbi:MAG: hypothetical protein E7K04_00385 [Helicobacter sp.]|nr:hypothetical protein [Helicobacter sp.]
MKNLLTISLILALGVSFAEDQIGSSDSSDAPQKHEKIGDITIGLEGALNYDLIKQTYAPGKSAQGQSGFTRNDFGSSNTDFELGIKGGYDYFITDHFGITGDLYIGAQTVAKGHQKILNYEVTNAYLGLKTGADLSLFYNFEKLGIFGGVGYRFVHFQSQFKDQDGKNVQHFVDGNSAASIEGYAFDDISLHSLLPHIGLKYIHNANEFYATYKFGGIIYDFSPRSHKFLEQTRNRSTQPSYLGYSETQILSTGIISIGYKYHFSL